MVRKIQRKEAKEQSSRKVFKGLLSKFGDEIIHLFDGSYRRRPIAVISSGVLGLNWVLGRGGYPKGRIVVMWGKESSGKSTVCYKLISSAQKAGLICAYVDVENSMDVEYLNSCGIDEKKNFILAQPDYGEQAFDVVEELIGKVDVIVVDSVAFLIPKAEAESDITDQFIGLQARLISKEMRRITPKMKGTDTVLVFTNQARAKIGQTFGFGPTESMPGGNALKHAASIVLELKRTKPIQNGTQQVGFMIKAKATKNKVGNPFRSIEIPMIFGYGIDDRLDFIELAMKSSIIKKKGGLYYLGKKVLGSGWLKVHNRIVSNERLNALVEDRITAWLEKQTMKEMSAGADSKRKKGDADDEEEG